MRAYDRLMISRSATATIVGLFVLIAHAAQAQSDLYWDANGATAGFGTAGGTWGTSVNWSTNALGSTLPDQPADTTASSVLHFGIATLGLEAGAVSVTGTQTFERVSFGIASAPISLTNGTLALAAPVSTIRLNSITNTIHSVVATNGSLKVRTLRPLICDGFPTLTEQILFRNATLSDYTGAEAIMGGASIAFGSPLPASVYFWENDGNLATCQIQCVDGPNTKCVKLQLSQSGPDIVGKALWAKYVAGSNLGYNFESGGTGTPVATWFTTAGYGVAELKLTPYDSRIQEYRFPRFLSTTAQTIASNATLSAFSAAECYMAGASFNSKVSPAYTYYFVNAGTNATFQVQMYDNIYTKCVKVELLQAGNHIQARILYAKYLAGLNLGYNFDLGGTGQFVATSFGASGYGIRSIRLKASQPTLSLAGENAFNGPVELAGPTLRLEGSLGNGAMTGTVTNNGALDLRPSAGQTLSGSVSGHGSLVVNGTPAPGATVIYNSALPAIGTYATIATNKTLASHTSPRAVFGGGGFGQWYVATPFFFVTDGTTATVQFQVYEAPYTKAVKVEFKQVGTSIQARRVYGKYKEASVLGADFDTLTGTGNNDYNFISLRLPNPGSVVLTGVNTYLGGTVVNSGELEATTTSSIPSFGGIVVYGGNLIMNASGFANPVTGALGGMNNPITVFAGGTLTLENVFNAGHSRPITLDGGTMNCTYNNNASDSVNYVCNLTMKNGARITGNAIRTGFTSPPTFRIQGVSPSFIEAGIMMVSTDQWSLEVDDVTGDDATDLTISGNLMNWPGLGHQTTRKRNAGTVSLSGNNAAYTGPVYIEAGCLRLDSLNALTSANAVVLEGGALVSTTFSNRVGNVLLNTGAIRLGTDKLIAGTARLNGDTELVMNTGSLDFADSSAMPWIAGKTLNIVGTLGRYSIRFGTTSAGLTTTQLQAIKLNGVSKPFKLDSQGYLVEERGTIIIIT